MNILYVLACLHLQPQVCMEFEVPVEQALPVPCFGAVNEWAQQHPKFRVSRFKCGPVEREV